MNQFPMTREGYLLAKDWLIQNGLWDRVSEEDGYSIVYYANSKYESQ